MKQIEISTTSWEQLHQLRYTLVRGKILPSRAAVVDELLRQYWRAGRTMIDPADYERIKPPKKGKPYPYKCRICGAPAAWTETFAARDRRHRLVSWRICEQCYRDAGGTMRAGQRTHNGDPPVRHSGAPTGRTSR